MGVLVSPPVSLTAPSQESFAASQKSPAPPALPSSFQPSRGKRTPLLLRSPIDLVLSILDHLDPPAVIALALTCKDLFAICASRDALAAVGRRPSSTSDVDSKTWRYEFLQLLMKDFEDPMMNCEDCSILHRPRISWHGPAPLQHPWTIMGYKCASQPSSYRLQRTGLDDSNHKTASSVEETNVKRFENTTLTVHSFNSLEVRLRVNWFAKIVNKQLYLKSVHGVRAYGLTTPQWANVISGLKGKQLTLCQHTQLPRRSFVPALDIPHVRRGSCSTCHTEFQTVSIGESKAPNPCGQFFVETYYCLGAPTFVNEAAQEGWASFAATRTASEKGVKPHRVEATEAWASNSEEGYFHAYVKELPCQTSEVKSLGDSVDTIAAMWKDETAGPGISAC